MSSSPMTLHPPYALPHSSAESTLPVTPDAFAAPAARLLPYVPLEVRVAAATAVIDAPVDAPLVAGVRLATPWQGAPAVEAAEALPSIDQFLVDSPRDDGALTMAALFAAPTAASDTDAARTVELNAEIDASIAADIDAAAEDALRVSSDDAMADVEPWAIAEATEAVAELADGLAGHVSAAETDAVVSEVLPLDATPLEPWSDDERWMDIMPALQTPGGPDLAGETAWARAFAEPPAPMTPPTLPAGDTDAAAASLEAIARRLRAGDLELPGFRGDRGDAAALAATLAAILGARS
jgi:hypothetical protein